MYRPLPINILQPVWQDVSGGSEAFLSRGLLRGATPYEQAAFSFPLSGLHGARP